MSRRRGNRADDSADVDMTPMLDIVFIMLIFFIVTATFLSEQGIDLTQPPDNQDQDEPLDPKPAITVYVDGRDQCSVDSSSSECDRVALRVERLLAEKPGASIILKVSEAASHGNLVFMKDNFDSKGLNVKVEIIPEG